MHSYPWWGPLWPPRLGEGKEGRKKGIPSFLSLTYPRFSLERKKKGGTPVPFFGNAFLFLNHWDSFNPHTLEGKKKCKRQSEENREANPRGTSSPAPPGPPHPPYPGSLSSLPNPRNSHFGQVSVSLLALQNMPGEYGSS